MTELNEGELNLLWADVLRRAGRRRPSARLLAAAAVVVAAVVVTPAVAVLVRSGPPRLPDGADANNVMVVLQPATGRLIVQAAPWKGHDGFCYLLLGRRAGCVSRSRGTVVMFPPVFGWSFDDRVKTATATGLSGRKVPLLVVHFGGRIDATIITARSRLPLLYRTLVLRDAQGHVVARFKGVR